jgi:hypothetical protein
MGYSAFAVPGVGTVGFQPGRLGAATNTSQLLLPFQGMYSVTSGAIPNSATLNDILGSGTQGSRANLFFELRNATVL